MLRRHRISLHEAVSSPSVIKNVAANGAARIRPVLRGLERAQAHADILSALDPCALANGKRGESDRAVAAIVLRDPSLLLEPIPVRYPLPQSADGDSWASADAVWSNYSKCYGTWLNRLAQPAVDFVETIRAALTAGIHPDDESAWGGKTLLACVGWCTSPEKLSLAFEFGARPTHQKGWHDSYFHDAMQDIRSSLSWNWEEPAKAKFRDSVRCAHILLDAGTLELDLPPFDPAADGAFAAARQLSVVGHLMDSGSEQRIDDEVNAAVQRLLSKLKCAGVDIDRDSGIMRLPPVVMALRCLNLAGACHLIEMGCRVDDEDIVRSSRTGNIETLLTEAHLAGGDAFHARITQAIMERQLHGAGAPAPTPAIEAPTKVPRRRLAI